MARMHLKKTAFIALLLLSCPACMTPGAGVATTAPVAPAAAVGFGVDPAAPVAAPPPPGPLAQCCEAIDDCRRKLCMTPFGQMLNGMTKPVSALTGGIIPTFCPAMPGAADLMKPGVMGEAAALKKDALEAKARREAVRYMGTVDCRYYPDVEGKLIAALRLDGSECVRYEAALALGRGCCCTKKVILALDIVVAGSDEDGAPVEKSGRVRDAAFDALQHCLACQPPAPVAVEVIPVDPKIKSKERPDLDKKDSELNVPKDADNTKDDMSKRRPDAATIEKARRTLANYQTIRPVSSTSEVPMERSLFGGLTPVTTPVPTPSVAPAVTNERMPEPSLPESPVANQMPQKLILPE
jgi:hypothetical protein